MSWIGIGVAAGTGAAIALFSAAVVKVTRIDRAKYGPWLNGMYIAVFALGLALSREFVTPQVERWYSAERFEEVLTENPAFAALRQHEPSSFEAMVATGKQALRDGAPVEAVQAGMRAHLVPVIERSMPVAEDQLVYAYMKVMTQEIRELHAGGDEACYTFLNPGTGAAFDTTRRFKPETLRADLDALGAVIRSAATAKQPRVTMREVQPQFNIVAAAVTKQFGADAELVSTPQSTLQGKRRACEIVAYIYDQALALSPKEGGRVMRAMLSE